MLAAPQVGVESDFEPCDGGQVASGRSVAEVEYRLGADVGGAGDGAYGVVGSDAQPVGDGLDQSRFGRSVLH